MVTNIFGKKIAKTTIFKGYVRYIFAILFC